MKILNLPIITAFMSMDAAFIDILSRDSNKEKSAEGWNAYFKNRRLIELSMICWINNLDKIDWKWLAENNILNSVDITIFKEEMELLNVPLTPEEEKHKDTVQKIKELIEKIAVDKPVKEQNNLTNLINNIEFSGFMNRMKKKN